MLAQITTEIARILNQTKVLVMSNEGCAMRSFIAILFIECPIYVECMLLDLGMKKYNYVR